MIRTGPWNQSPWHSSVTIQYSFPASDAPPIPTTIRANLEQAHLECRNLHCPDPGRPSDAAIAELSVDWTQLRKSLDATNAALASFRARLSKHLTEFVNGNAVRIITGKPAIAATDGPPVLSVPIQVQIDNDQYRKNIGAIEAELKDFGVASAPFTCHIPLATSPYSLARRTPIAPFGSINHSCVAAARAALDSRLSEPFHTFILLKEVQQASPTQGVVYAVPLAAIDPNTRNSLIHAQHLLVLQLVFYAADGTTLLEHCAAADRGGRKDDSAIPCGDRPRHADLNPLGYASIDSPHQAHGSTYLFAPLVFDNVTFGDGPWLRWQAGYSIQTQVSLPLATLSLLARIEARIITSAGN